MIANLENTDNRIEQIVVDLSSRGIAARGCIERLFSFIEAPEHLKGLSTACKNLLKVLPKVEAIARSEGRNFQPLLIDIGAWLKIVRILSETSEQVKTSLRGDYTGSHALYVALWHSPKKTDLADKYSSLMAMLCVALMKLHVREVKGERYQSARYNATLRARQLIKLQYESVLQSLPQECRSLQQYFEEIGKGNDPFLHDIWVLLEYAVKGKAGITRKVEGRRWDQSASILADEPPDFDCENDAEFQVVQRIQLPQDKEELKRVRKTLTSPIEFNEGSESFQIKTKNPKTSRQDAFLSRKVAKQLAMQNQLLPYRWNTLTTYEVACFLESVQELMKEQRVAKVPGPELAAFLSVMFWLSARPETVCKFNLYSNRPRGRFGNGYIEAAGRQSRPAWVVNPPQPVGYSKPSRRRFKALRSEQIIYLPVPKPAEIIMTNYLDRLPPEKRIKGLFNREEPVYRAAISDFFTNLRVKERLRFTPALLADYLFDRLMHLPGSDIVTAMLATGRGHFLGFVQLHYTVIEVKRLRAQYTEVCSSIVTESTSEIGVHKNVAPNIHSGGDFEKEWTGSRYCPLGDTVSILVAKLKKLLSEEIEESVDVTDLFRLHNRLVTYTTLLIGFATGYRSVVDPFLRKALIDRSTGLTVISDKDNDKFVHSRIIWVPEMVLEQLDRYHSHLKALSRHLLTMNRPLYYAIRASLEEARSQPVLFFIRRNMRGLPVHQKILEDIYEFRLNCTIPANANRHYLRTHLLRDGCPPDIIDAFMGHSSHGREAWGKFSSLSPLRYKESLRQYLLPILERNGWEVMSGLSLDHV